MFTSSTHAALNLFLVASTSSCVHIPAAGLSLYMLLQITLFPSLHHAPLEFSVCRLRRAGRLGPFYGQTGIFFLTVTPIPPDLLPEKNQFCCRVMWGNVNEAESEAKGLLVRTWYNIMSHISGRGDRVYIFFKSIYVSVAVLNVTLFLTTLTSVQRDWTANPYLIRRIKIRAVLSYLLRGY